MRASNIKYIVIHCTAGFGGRAIVENHWKKLGWKNVGYHRLIELNGQIHKLSSFENDTNGVLGYNPECIHISYVGGVDKNNPAIAKDTRTEIQKQAIISCIKEALDWLKLNNIDITKITILGHRDFSDDKNKNGVIDPNERIKECPSFDAMPEYLHFTGQRIVPKNKIK